MNPVVGLGLAQPELQAVHRLQRIRLLIDKKKEQLVCHLRQDAFGAATDLPLAYLPLPGLGRWIQRCIGRSKRRSTRANSACVSPVAAKNSRGLFCKVL